MLSRIARNDVVRSIRTGEVGLVKGWADHENLDRYGTIVDVELAKGKTMQANGLALEFVADAKVGKGDTSKVKAVWTFIAALFSTLWGALSGWSLADGYGTPLVTSAFVGYTAMYFVWRFLWYLTIRPKKTRIRLPRKQVQHPSGDQVGGFGPAGMHKR